MSNLTDKGKWPPEYAADLHIMDCKNAAELLSQPWNAAELTSVERANVRRSLDAADELDKEENNAKATDDEPVNHWAESCGPQDEDSRYAPLLGPEGL